MATYLVESCPGGELSRVGNRTGGELSCWGILVDSSAWELFSGTFKAPS